LTQRQLPTRHRARGECPSKLIRNANLEWLTNPDSGTQALNDRLSSGRSAGMARGDSRITIPSHFSLWKSFAYEAFARIARHRPHGDASDRYSVKETGKRKVDEPAPIRGEEDRIVPDTEENFLQTAIGASSGNKRSTSIDDGWVTGPADN
jgi:hypothetical protein